MTIIVHIVAANATGYSKGFGVIRTLSGGNFHFRPPFIATVFDIWTLSKDINQQGIFRAKCKLMGKMKIYLTLFLVFPILVASNIACMRNNSNSLNPESEIEIKTLSGQLADPDRSAKTKTEAAELLLSKIYPEAEEALEAFLRDSSNPSAQAAIAEAIARRGCGNESLVKPLFAMLTGDEPSVRIPAAKALVTYRNSMVSEQLIDTAEDRRKNVAVRLVTISALQRVLDKDVLDALVGLLEDHDPSVRSASAQTLAKLTSIKTFGTDAELWQQWWEENKDKKKSEWLADLTESLVRTNQDLESKNLILHKRIEETISELYAVTPAAEQEELLLKLLTDPMAEVRLVGASLTDSRITANESISENLRYQIRSMLSDKDDRLRKAVALLMAHLVDEDTVSVILARLEIEKVPDVKQALLTALGQSRAPKALPAVLVEIDSNNEQIAAAAAAALTRIASENPLEETQTAEAVEVLIGRYKKVHKKLNGLQTQKLREELLAAMGALGHEAVADVLKIALRDPAATIRLAAVKGLAKLGLPSSTAAIKPLAGDVDRGVRQAAITALGFLGGKESLPTIIARSDPSVEKDAIVREQAWEVAMSVLEKADAETLREVSKLLAKRDNTVEKRIEIFNMLVEVLKTKGGTDLANAQLELGNLLMEASRPSEASVHLQKAYALLAAEKSSKADSVWDQWTDSLIEANDPQVCKVMMENSDDRAFAGALNRLYRKMISLRNAQKFQASILLCSESIKTLSPRLTVGQRTKLENLLSDIEQAQLVDDMETVTKLASQLTAADESASKATEELKSMGVRAVRPLVVQLRKAVTSEMPDPQMEKAILAVLRQLAPNLNDYDPQAPVAERIKLVDSWLSGFEK